LQSFISQCYFSGGTLVRAGGRKMRNAQPGGASASERAALLLRLLLASLFIAHLYWKFVIFPGGLEAWWANLLNAGYPAFVPAYVLSAELAGALLLIPGVLTRYIACYAMPMMLGAAHFWMTRNGFFFIKAGAELPCVWLALLGIQAVAGDGAFAAVRSPDPRRALAWVRRRRLAAVSA
jgi:putative oxidoreductase